MSTRQPPERIAVVDAEHLRTVINAIANSVLFSEPVLLIKDVTALRELAESIGLDPGTDATPSYLKHHFPHRFEPNSVNASYCNVCALAGAIVIADAEVHAMCTARWGVNNGKPMYLCEREAGHGGGRHRQGDVIW